MADVEAKYYTGNNAITINHSNILNIGIFEIPPNNLDNATQEQTLKLIHTTLIHALNL